MHKNNPSIKLQTKHKTWLFAIFIVLLSFGACLVFSSARAPHLQYTLAFPHPGSHSYQIELQLEHWKKDSICLKLPNWMPGYYQMMHYAENLEDLTAKDKNGNNMPIERLNSHTWCIRNIKHKSIQISYTMRTHRQFVASSYVDTNHAYLVPTSSFLYADSLLQMPVQVKLILPPAWNDIATGLEPVQGKPDVFWAPDFDILYDCPILAGRLEKLPSFKIKGIEHRFIGYKLGDFDRLLFMDHLKRTVQAAIDFIGDIPYKQYTFIAIGPGHGGIEHLNNTTVSFDGSQLNTPESMNRTMRFLAHEYFHHYNVKRVRPFELGPFDYENGNRTNLLWVSEGFTVYYENLVLKRAGLIDTTEFLSDLTAQLNTLENDPGRFHQSLAQASYNTWEDGPFGSAGTGEDHSISIYNKGTIVGMLLDLEIRHATGNHKSLDHVMRKLYREYYKEKKRGFTDAEFQQVCEQVAGISLTSLFEYVYTTKEIDYAHYLGYAGLGIERQSNTGSTTTPEFRLYRLPHPNGLQTAIRQSWLGE